MSAILGIGILKPPSSKSPHSITMMAFFLSGCSSFHFLMIVFGIDVLPIPGAPYIQSALESFLPVKPGTFNRTLDTSFSSCGVVISIIFKPPLFASRPTLASVSVLSPFSARSFINST